MLGGADPNALVLDGTIQSGWTENTDPNARSMIGYTSDHAPVIVATTRGALTYQQSAEIMKNIGCEGAIMLDGGSSTSMYEKESGMLKDSAFYRKVANAIVISDK